MATPSLIWMLPGLVPRCCTGLHCKSCRRNALRLSRPPLLDTTLKGIWAVFSDRCFISLPAHLFTLNKVSHIVEQGPRGFFKSGLSDHAPIAITFHFRATAVPGEGIPINIGPTSIFWRTSPGKNILFIRNLIISWKKSNL